MRARRATSYWSTSYLSETERFHPHAPNDSARGCRIVGRPPKARTRTRGGNRPSIPTVPRAPRSTHAGTTLAQAARATPHEPQRSMAIRGTSRAVPSRVRRPSSGRWPRTGLGALQGRTALLEHRQDDGGTSAHLV